MQQRDLCVEILKNLLYVMKTGSESNGRSAERRTVGVNMGHMKKYYGQFQNSMLVFLAQFTRKWCNIFLHEIINLQAYQLKV